MLKTVSMKINVHVLIFYLKLGIDEINYIQTSSMYDNHIARKYRSISNDVYICIWLHGR